MDHVASCSCSDPALEGKVQLLEIGCTPRGQRTVGRSKILSDLPIFVSPTGESHAIGRASLSDMVIGSKSRVAGESEP